MQWITPAGWESAPKIAVVIPSYRVRAHILDVIARIGPEVGAIYVVDDACPEGSGQFVEENVADPRVTVLHNPINLGVGGATLAGMQEAAAKGADVIVKIDGDGQMDPSLLLDFVAPIISGEADYTKGNRFFNPVDVAAMPGIRLLGNAALSLLSKASSGYWSVFDPTNGYTAIHASLLKLLPIDKIHKRYFFESDMLLHLYLLRAAVIDIPMTAIYENEVSNLSIRKIFGQFLYCHLRNFLNRIFFTYLLRDFSIATVHLLVGSLLLTFGVIYGCDKWYHAYVSGTLTSGGNIMLAVLPILLGVQLILAFLAYDMVNQPRASLHTRLAWRSHMGVAKALNKAVL